MNQDGNPRASVVALPQRCGQPQHSPARLCAERFPVRIAVSADREPNPAAHDEKIIIIAGPNGAGKTAFARSFLPHKAQCQRFINADLIAAGLSPFAPEQAALKAGRLMLLEIGECVRKGESFALETTLAGLA